MMAAESAFKAVTAERADSNGPIVLSDYEQAYRDSWVYDELHEVRNIRPSFHTPLGLVGACIWSGLDTVLLRGRVPFTFPHSKPDSDMLIPAR